uniref:Uncharacterized protein n=1 Tax=uncultured prokaryote TaxID=198431 RepID=A0A0H5Q5U4_9ZZZZ|nr:hypothetical protein [uncultured prokaryote]
MALRTPVTIVVTVYRHRPDDAYARVVGYGLTEHGGYGSLWGYELPLPGADRRAPARRVLRLLAGALLAQLGDD